MTFCKKPFSHSLRVRRRGEKRDSVQKVIFCIQLSRNKYKEYKHKEKKNKSLWILYACTYNVY